MRLNIDSFNGNRPYVRKPYIQVTYFKTDQNNQIPFIYICLKESFTEESFSKYVYLLNRILVNGVCQRNLLT